jgi:LmbE family N-acetylglucosaminyl deacetylase
MLSLDLASPGAPLRVLCLGAHSDDNGLQIAAAADATEPSFIFCLDPASCVQAELGGRINGECAAAGGR